MCQAEDVTFRSFVIRLPSGVRYWTVVTDDLVPVAAVDEFLRDLRFGRDVAESTTRTYAGGIGLYLRWCASTGREWQTAAERMGAFMLWLRYAPSRGASVVTPGPGAKPVRGARRVNTVLAAVREFLRHQVRLGEVPASVLAQLYEISDDHDLPDEVRGEGSGLRYVAKARHRLSEPREPVDRATDEEVVALFTACRSARDRLIVLLLGRVGLRRSEAAGLRREDVHFSRDSTALGCRFAGPHLHVVRRDNVNGAWAKSRTERKVPVDFLVVQAHDQYVIERGGRPAAAHSDFLLVNLFREPIGQPMPPVAVNELLVRLTSRAGLGRNVHPHMLRHGFGSNVLDAGGGLDELQALMGHASITSSQPYIHPSQHRLREAVERVGTLGRPEGRLGR
jgi:site-specific recombinase XerD